jgi:hypothetical protein
MKTKKAIEPVALASKNAALDQLLATIRRLPDAKLVSLQVEVDQLLKQRGKKSKGNRTPHMR